MLIKSIVYFNGQFLPENEVHISPNDRGFVFADGTYEVLRTYNGKLLLADEHLARLHYSLEQLKITKPNIDSFKDIFYKLLEQNDLNDKLGTIFIQVTRGVYKRMHAFPDEIVEPTVFIRATSFTPYSKRLSEGVKVISIEDFRWTRCDIKSISLLPNILSAQDAIDNDAYEAVFVRNNDITEGTHTNVFGVIDGVVYTHPKSNLILSGISRELVIEACQQNNIPIKLEPFKEDQFSKLDEMFLAGTSTEVMPVVQLNDQILSRGKPGNITLKIQKFYDEIIVQYLEQQTAYIS